MTGLIESILLYFYSWRLFFCPNFCPVWYAMQCVKSSALCLVSLYRQQESKICPKRIFGQTSMLCAEEGVRSFKECKKNVSSPVSKTVSASKKAKRSRTRKIHRAKNAAKGCLLHGICLCGRRRSAAPSESLSIGRLPAHKSTSFFDRHSRRRVDLRRQRYQQQILSPFCRRRDHGCCTVLSHN